MFKKPLQFPQQEESEPMAGGIGGLHDNISPTNRPLNLLSVCRNMRRFGVSAAQTRGGRGIIGDQVGVTRILGLSGYYTASLKKLIAQSGTVLKVYNPGTDVWDTMQDSVGGYAATAANFEAVTFNDLFIFTNGTDNVQKFNGTITAALGGTPPKGEYIASAYQRVFISGVSGSPHLLYASDVANEEEWTVGDSAAVPVNDKDGDEIKWTVLYKSNLCIWKRYGLFELHGPEIRQTTDNWSVFPIAMIGTPNGRTIADVNGLLYWLSDSENSKGIVRWGSGRPVLISEPVDDIINSINYGAIGTACAASNGEGEYLLAVPTGASTYPDTIIVYNANDNSWWVWEDWNPTAFLSYRMGDTSTLLMGDNSGYVYSHSGTIDE